MFPASISGGIHFPFWRAYNPLPDSTVVQLRISNRWQYFIHASLAECGLEIPIGQLCKSGFQSTRPSRDAAA